jgi:hypothetical protein
MNRFSILCAGCALLLARPAWAEQFAPQALNSFSVTPEKIHTAQVFNQEGQAIGTVQRVATDQSGKPVQLDIALYRNGAVISVSAVDASYEAASNIVVARSSAVPGQKPAG